MTNQPAQCHGRAARSPRLAVNVNSMSLLYVRLNKLDRSFHVRKIGMGKIGRGHVKLLYPNLSVFSNRASIFVASVDDSTNTRLMQPADMSSKRQCSQDDLRIDVVPPASGRNQTHKEQIPHESWHEECARDQTIHHGLKSEWSETMQGGYRGLAILRGAGKHLDEEFVEVFV